ncbi:hypothetical protein V1514DRAFT_367154 [Lipomyces japonicus]|uniref:uncharacterized protein n=1 Tax=Lipomyces japonicus TaxID=56871 RepID=UPI0034CD0BB9
MSQLEIKHLEPSQVLIDHDWPDKTAAGKQRSTSHGPLVLCRRNASIVQTPQSSYGNVFYSSRRPVPGQILNYDPFSNGYHHYYLAMVRAVVCAWATLYNPYLGCLVTFFIFGPREARHRSSQYLVRDRPVTT